MPDSTLDPALRQALSRRFERIVVFSGAGMSADSGIPTFRSGSNGLWHEFDPQQLATPQAWRRDSALVWGWYEWRRGLVMQAAPNPGHLAVARLQQALGAQVVTQNVDDLHERAGSRDVVHLHGSLFATRCFDCGRPAVPDPILEGLDAIGGEGAREAPPACVACGGPCRPGVVWFGEPLPADAWERACEALAACELLVVVGTSGLVQPAASLPRLAREAGARVVEINPVESAVSALAHESLRMGAGEGMRVLAERLG